MELKLEQSSGNSIDKQPIKAFGYACFPKDTKITVSPDLMSAFIAAALPYTPVEVVDSFIESNSKKGFVTRWKWHSMIERCQEEGVKLIVIPAIKLLSYHTMEALDKAKKIKAEYDIDTYFILEDIQTGSEDAPMRINMHCLIQQYNDDLGDRKNSLRNKFRETSWGLGIGVYTNRTVYPNR